MWDSGEQESSSVPLTDPNTVETGLTSFSNWHPLPMPLRLLTALSVTSLGPSLSNCLLTPPTVLSAYSHPQLPPRFFPFPTFQKTNCSPHPPVSLVQSLNPNCPLPPTSHTRHCLSFQMNHRLHGDRTWVSLLFIPTALIPVPGTKNNLKHIPRGGIWAFSLKQKVSDLYRAFALKTYHAGHSGTCL